MENAVICQNCFSRSGTFSLRDKLQSSENPIWFQVFCILRPPTSHEHRYRLEFQLPRSQFVCLFKIVIFSHSTAGKAAIWVTEAFPDFFQLIWGPITRPQLMAKYVFCRKILLPPPPVQGHVYAWGHAYQMLLVPAGYGAPALPWWEKFELFKMLSAKISIM